MASDIKELQSLIQKFCEDRDWDQYHGGKDLAIGAVTEASELLEHFRFLTSDQVEKSLADEKSRQAIGEELADILFFILRFAQRYDFDLKNCIENKMQKNALKYPVDQFKGKNHKSNIDISNN